jgi:tetratricopeptide (TPR) repeat protein
MRAALIAVLLALPPAAAAQASAAGQIFEDGVGGRLAAMGGAGAAAAHDASSIYYNPAGLALMPGSELQLMRENLYGGATLNSFDFGRAPKAHPVGYGVQVMQLGVAGASGRDASDNPTASFSYSELALSAGMGVHGLLMPNLSLGGAAKVLTRTLPGSSDRFIAADAGAQYGPLFDSLQLGAVLRNFAALSSGDTSDKLPASVRFGATWTPVKPLTLTAEVSTAEEIRAGVEWAWSTVALRAGYGPTGPTFGGGLRFREAFSFDVALIESLSQGMSEKITLGYRFGHKRLHNISDDFIKEARAALAGRDYETALKNMEAAVGVGAGVDDGRWRRRAERLRLLSSSAEILQAEPDRAELRASSPAALLAQRAVDELLEGRDEPAMLLFHVAAGAGGTNSVYMRLLSGASLVTRQSISRADILPPAIFVQERAKRVTDLVRAKRFEQAAAAGREAVLVAPDDAGAWMRLGSAYFAAKDRDRALEAYKKSLELDPADAHLKKFVDENWKE